jgi:hypothetical protein
MSQPVRLTAAETEALTHRISNEDVKKRVLAEARVVKLFCETMIAAQFSISLYDGEEWTVKRSTDVNKIMEAIQTTDMDNLRVRAPCGEHMGDCLFIYGNSASEVINDYHTALEEWMGPVTEYTDMLAARGE